jgi:glucan biosynthesis protein C
MPSSGVRYYYMDSLRSILMSLGVVLHAARLYGTEGDWVVSDPVQDPVYNGVSWFIHIFRMPAFFVIAGFFAAMVFSKYGWRRFISNRMQRIGVPLVCAAVLLNFPQAILIHLFTGARGAERASDLLASSWQIWSGGRWVAHLWFLIVLIVYYAMVLLLEWRWAAGSVGARRLKAIFSNSINKLNPKHLLDLVILAAPGWMVLVMAGTKVAPRLFQAQGLLQVDLYTLLEYAPFFVLGYLLYGRDQMIREFSRPAWYDALVISAGGAGLYAVRGAKGLVVGTVRTYAYTLLQWKTSQLCFALALRFMNRPSRGFYFLSDASYTIYLFHHILVVGMGFALLDRPWGPHLKFALVVVVTYGLCITIHRYVIMRYSKVSLMFNGRAR